MPVKVQHPSDGEPDYPIEADGTYVSLSRYEGIQIPSARLKTNKAGEANGLPSWLFKCGRENPQSACYSSFSRRIKACPALCVN